MLRNRASSQWVRKRQESSWKRGRQLSSSGPWVLPNSSALRTDTKNHAGSVGRLKGKTALKGIGNGGEGEDGPRAPRPSSLLRGCELRSVSGPTGGPTCRSPRLDLPGPRAERAGPRPSPLPFDIWALRWFPRAPRTKSHQLGDSDNRHGLCHRFRV